MVFDKNVFGKKKSGKLPAEENCFFAKETLFLGKKRRLRQAASRREKFWVKTSGIRIGDNPIGGGAARCEKRLFLL